MDIKIIENALKRAYLLGQQYWQQADSEYVSQHKKADETGNKFTALLAETLKAIEAAPAVEPGQPEQAWEHYAKKLTRWLYCMSYNDSYFGEPAGLVKQVTAELERLIGKPAKPAPVEFELDAETRAMVLELLTVLDYAMFEFADTEQKVIELKNKIRERNQS